MKDRRYSGRICRIQRRCCSRCRVRVARKRKTPGALMSDALACEGVVKRNGETVAVDGVSVRVKRGEVFGLIGPNGAGKTSLVECLAGLGERNGGRGELLGM